MREKNLILECSKEYDDIEEILEWLLITKEDYVNSKCDGHCSISFDKYKSVILTNGILDDYMLRHIQREYPNHLWLTIAIRERVTSSPGLIAIHTERVPNNCDEILKIGRFSLILANMDKAPAKSDPLSGQYELMALIKSDLEIK